MKTNLLLQDEATRPMQLLQNAMPAKVRLRETGTAVAGCNCDRWGHPCPSCVERICSNESGASDFITHQEMTQDMEYLIIFSVAEDWR